MIPNLIYKHKQPTHNTCAQAAVATILGITLAEVPNFHDAGSEISDFWDAFDDFMAQRGFYADMRTEVIPDKGFYLASGPTLRNNGNHMVVMYGKELAHDPHEDNTGLTKIEYTHVLVPLQPSHVVL